MITCASAATIFSMFFGDAIFLPAKVINEKQFLLIFYYYFYTTNCYDYA